MANSKQRRRRAPIGVDGRQIAMRLMPDERKHFDQLVQQHGLTDGAMAREVFLAGLPIWLAQQTATA